MSTLDDYDDVWDAGLDAATWSPPPAPPRPPLHKVTIYVPPGVNPDTMWSLHVFAALLEGRCPKCYDGLIDGWGRWTGWTACVLHGWWRRDRDSWEWDLGFDPHSGEPSW